MDQQTLDTLEFDVLKGLLVENVQSPLGAKMARTLSPSSDPQQIRLNLARTSECVELLREDSLDLRDLKDPTEILNRLPVENVNLEPMQILEATTMIAVAMDVRNQLGRFRQRFPALWEVAARIPDLRRLYSALRGRILPSGEVDTDASPELRRIRREINELRTRIHHSLEGIMRRAEANVIQDEIITIRNGRFVIPVRSDFRGHIPGVMHGMSSSGQTVFVEPLSTIEQNNDLVNLQELEEIEITRILFNLTSLLREERENFKQLVDALAEIDFIAAKARLSRQFNCCAPEINESGILSVANARHPLLEKNLKAQGREVVPISLELDSNSPVMVISGPNAGGKTVVLKTVGLLALMAQSGLHVPAERASFPVFKHILADIGDHQSIAANLSTFSAHIKNVSEMAEMVEPPALVLIDEVGTGTDPDEGAALAVSIVDYFKRKGAMLLVSTHYNRLKMYAYNTDGVVNASVEFDEKTLQPTYRLITGIAGTSSGIEIARRLGVTSEITDQAFQLIRQSDADSNQYLKRLKAELDAQRDLTAAMEEERAALAEKFARLELDFIKKDRQRSVQFEAELKRIVENFTLESEKFLKQIQDHRAAVRLQKEAEKRASELRRKAREAIKRQEADLPAATHKIEEQAIDDWGQALGADFRVGDPVRVTSIGQEGVIESIRGDEFDVRVGAVRFKASRNDLTPLRAERYSPKEGKRTAPKILPKGIDVVLKEEPNVPSELNVIGCTVDEATSRADKFLDDAYLSNLSTVRIVHGSGMGILRKALTRFLSDHPHVASFHPAPPSEGGGGATVVELKT